MFGTVLVANRGEIAVRVIRTLRELGIRSVAVYSDADASARHVREADVAVRIGPAAARDSYLSIERIVAAAVDTGAQAVHPGYGFLAENASFARACEAAGLVFVGPSPVVIEAMGDKIFARGLAAEAGVPVLPGTDGGTDEELIRAADGMTYPLLVKPSAGGGGTGMHRVDDPADLPGALATARREATAAFGDGTLLLERFLPHARHIEVQILADTHGTVLHLGERDCSLQRRHQKIVEETPAPGLPQDVRDRLTEAAVRLARAVGYTSTGTVEFVMDTGPRAFFFLEMNTRLQVEHPVTELVTGLDLVAEQLRIAAGLPLTVPAASRGHAIEARVYAEDPARGFLPTGGRPLLVRHPTDVRVDSSLDGSTAELAVTYDPMLAKIVAHGPDRATALARLDRALADTVVLGVGTNVAFVRALLAQPDVAAGRTDTRLVERVVGGLIEGTTPAAALVAYALGRLLDARGTDPWENPTGWRVGGPAATRFVVTLPEGGTSTVAVRVTALTATGVRADVSIEDGRPVDAAAERDGDGLRLTLAGRTTRWWQAADGLVRWLGADGAAWALAPGTPTSRHRGADRTEAEVRSPMPGTVTAVHTGEGDTVAAGTPLLVVEAMKMEHTVRAPHPGLVKQLLARAGDRVALGQPLAVVEPAP